MLGLRRAGAAFAELLSGYGRRSATH